MLHNKTSYIPSLFLLCTLMACSKEATSTDSIRENETEYCIPARIENTSSATRVALDTDTGVCRWSPDDFIAMFVTNDLPDGMAGAFNKYKTAGVVDGSVRLSLASDQVRKGYAVYPYNVIDADNPGVETGSSLHLNYPATYSCGLYTTAGGNNPLATWSPAPMVSFNTEDKVEFNFFHVGGLLTLTLTDVPAGTTRLEVTFVGDETDPADLLGDVTGNFQVNAPGTKNATVTLASGTGNTVIFKDLYNAYEEVMTLNIPLPTQNYAKLTAVQVRASGGTVSCTVSKHVEGWGELGHGKGKRLTIDFNSITGSLGTFRGYHIHPGVLKWDETLRGGIGGYTLTDGTDPLELLRYYGDNSSFGFYYHQWRGSNSNTLKYRFDGNNDIEDLQNAFIVVDGLTWSIPSPEDWLTIYSGQESDFSSSILVNNKSAADASNNFAEVRVNLTGSEYEGMGLSETNYISGLLLFPDGVRVSCPGITKTGKQAFSSNTITYPVLKLLLDGGCAFLPCAGGYARFGADVAKWRLGGTAGMYWNSSAYPTNTRAGYLYFRDSSIYNGSDNIGETSGRLPVRMVHQSF